MLNTIHHSSTGLASPLVIAHGLYGSGRNWGVIAKRLSDRGPVACVDMRNHGQSGWEETQSYPDMAGDLAEVLAAQGGGDVVGHSMGGKAAMMLALTRPDLVRRLVVADIAPVTYGHSQLPYISAMRAVDLSHVEKRSDVAAQLVTDDPVISSFLLQSVDIKEKRWRLNLDVLEREMPKIIGFPEVEARFDGPVLFLSGGVSEYVLPEHRPRIRALFPRARFARIPGAGHWLHAEKPREFEGTVRAFLEAPQG